MLSVDAEMCKFIQKQKWPAKFRFEEVWVCLTVLLQEGYPLRIVLMGPDLL
jgi:hypothetical protein